MRRNKDFLRNIKKLTALVLAAAAIVTAYNIPIDKTRTITGFMPVSYTHLLGLKSVAYEWAEDYHGKKLNDELEVRYTV